MSDVGIPAGARVGRVRLVVGNLAASLDFYEATVGLTAIAQAVGSASLGTPDGTVLLELREQAGVRRLRDRRRLGIYHLAVLLPGRADLARFARHLMERQVPAGSSDHLVSEAFYLVDPDGIHVEIYADRPRETWQFAGGQVRMAVDPIDMRALLAAGDGGWTGAPNGTTMGHMHFYVGDLEVARRLYTEGMGMAVMAALGGSALFVSAGGYHHHVGLNVWAAGSPLASDLDARMADWELVLPDRAAVERTTARMVTAGFRAAGDGLEDAWGIRVRVVSEG